MQAKRTYKLVGVLALSVNKKGVTCFPPFLCPGNAQTLRQIAKIRGYGCGDCSQAGRPEDLPFPFGAKIRKGVETVNSLQGLAYISKASADLQMVPTRPKTPFAMMLRAVSSASASLTAVTVSVSCSSNSVVIFTE